MGQSSAETVREIEDTRNRLEEEIRELEERLPAPARWGKRLVGVAAAGGVATTAALFLYRRRRAKKRRAQATPVQAVVQVLPERWAERLSETLEDGTWKPWLAGAAGLWVAFRLAELRQLRRINRALLPAVR